ncbi:MAG: hypothetical protein A3F68_12580 [Acidobacteria bacterium RIFCSPLOWO2_12_FULL_54_10]|nr:MAG: hypothetical protein A3F68_12580 [Acidobacteria bacterium RIFCSPLOWO2_12_FULL_54_10]
MLPTESVISSKASEESARPALQESNGSRLSVIFYILVCIEIGLFLLLAPWTWVWEQSVSPSFLSEISWIYLSPYCRGAVSGLGLVNIWLGLSRTATIR